MTSQIANIESSNALSIPGLEGISRDDILKHTPYLILVQGNNPLKDEFPSIKDGDIVGNDGTPFGQPVDYILLKSKLVYIQKEIEIGKDGKLKAEAPTIAVLDAAEYNKLVPHTKDQMDTYEIHKDKKGEITGIFLPNLIFLGLANGAPYQISFKSFMKRKAAEKMLASVITSLITYKAKNPYEVVLELRARKAKSRSGIGYFSLEGRVSRRATQEELEVVQLYTGIDISTHSDETAVDVENVAF